MSAMVPRTGRTCSVTPLPPPTPPPHFVHRTTNPEQKYRLAFSFDVVPASPRHTIVPAVIDGIRTSRIKETRVNKMRIVAAGLLLGACLPGVAAAQVCKVPTLRVLAQKSLGLSVMESRWPTTRRRAAPRSRSAISAKTTAARNRGSTRRPARVPTRSTTSTRRTSPNSRRPTGSCRSSSTTRRNTTTTTSCPAAARLRATTASRTSRR